MGVLFSTLKDYFLGMLLHIPGAHWVIIVVFSLALSSYLMIRKKCSLHGAICLGIAMFVGLLLIETAVVIRYLGVVGHNSGHDMTFDFSRFLRKSGEVPAEGISNIAAFIPFGLFLSEFLASAKRFSARRRLGLATLAGFGLSLCIECLQLLLRVGFFELTDLVMNTLGAFVGSGFAILLRRFLRSLTLGRNDKEIPGAT